MTQAERTRGLRTRVLRRVGHRDHGASTAAPGAGARPKWSRSTSSRDTLYVLKGGGGNTALFLTATGAVLVDTKLPGWGQPLLDKVKGLTDKPVTMVINTHAHYDHTNGQVEFPAVGRGRGAREHQDATWSRPIRSTPCRPARSRTSSRSTAGAACRAAPSTTR